VLIGYLGLVKRKLWLGALLAIGFNVMVKLFYSNSLELLLVPIANGMIVAFELAILLFGAYLFYAMLNANHHFDTLKKITTGFSSKISILIILCLFLCTFMEGIAGFGIPSMLIAPMLLSLGFRPISSVVLPLATNITAVTFGALGTPIKVGLGIWQPNEVIHFTLIINFIPALLLPFFIIWLYNVTNAKDGLDWKQYWPVLIGAGGIYAILYFISGHFTVEFTSAIVGFVGLMCFVLFFVPNNERPPAFYWVKTFYPYFIFIVTLLLAKPILLQHQWQMHTGVKSISLYQPGLIFVFTGMVYYLIKLDKKNSFVFDVKPFRDTIHITLKPIFTITLLVVFAQLIRVELSDLAQHSLKDMHWVIRIFLNPILGIVGSSLSGSATMSNLIFIDSIKFSDPISSQLALLMAMFHSGSAIGNPIALQNILMVKSVVNHHEVDFIKILKINAQICLTYTLLIIAIGLMCWLVLFRV
jgi:L-lactate permease